MSGICGLERHIRPDRCDWCVWWHNHTGGGGGYFRGSVRHPAQVREAVLARLTRYPPPGYVIEQVRAGTISLAFEPGREPAGRPALRRTKGGQTV